MNRGEPLRPRCLALTCQQRQRQHCCCCCCHQYHTCRMHLYCDWSCAEAVLHTRQLSPKLSHQTLQKNQNGNLVGHSPHKALARRSTIYLQMGSHLGQPQTATVKRNSLHFGRRSTSPWPPLPPPPLQRPATRWRRSSLASRRWSSSMPVRVSQLEHFWLPGTVVFGPWT